MSLQPAPIVITQIPLMSPAAQDDLDQLNKPQTPMDALEAIGLKPQQAAEVIANMQAVGGYTPDQLLEAIQAPGFNPNDWTNEGVASRGQRPALG